jgi:4-hydroxy-tetrahydrodipicolinate synthase
MALLSDVIGDQVGSLNTYKTGRLDLGSRSGAVNLDLSLSNDFAGALKLHIKILPLYKALFVESNPIAVKYAASVLGLCKNEIRLPLLTLEENNIDYVKSTMLELGIL